jgi:opacity protein-like surface antigen
MRKIIFITILLNVYQLANAQIKLGLRLAPQLTWSKPDNKVTSTNGTRVNAAYGLMIDYYFTDNYAIGTEFSLQSMGTNMQIDQSRFTNISADSLTHPSTGDLKYDYRLRYIQVPVILKMRTKEIGYMRYYAEFGFAFSFLTRAKADVSMGTTFERENININEPDEEDEFRLAPTDYDTRANSIRTGLIMGAGLQYNMFGNSLLVVGLRYDNGFSNFMKDDRLKTTINYLALNIGVLF